MIGKVLGGIGLFLTGMLLATEGLRAAAGDALRRVLLRFTGGPLKALLSGAAITVLVQSSSAVTVAMIGFVGAGLLSFEQALGVIFGANIGTTSTGWLVALVGLKFSVSSVALPLVGVGALLKLFTRGRAGDVGLAVSGFGIIFVGIDVLQAGMQGMSALLTPARLPSDTLLGRLALVGMGAGLSAAMQSSSAAMTTTLTALHAGSISLRQAAAVVIGVNIGTTVTAGIAAVGAKTAVKRTAFAHLLFNVITAVVAFALLPVFVAVFASVGTKLGRSDATISVTAFHTVFNVLGVALLLPLTRPFARVVQRVIKERGPRLTRLLAPRAKHMGAVAMEGVRQTGFEIFGAVLAVLRVGLSKRAVTAKERDQLAEAADALGKTARYMAELRSVEHASEAQHRRHRSTLHALDHLERLVDVTARALDATFVDDAEIAATHGELTRLLELLEGWVVDAGVESPLEQVEGFSTRLADRRRAQRKDLLDATARGERDPTEVGDVLEAMRRIDEIAYYLWRITEHLGGERSRKATAAPRS